MSALKNFMKFIIPTEPEPITDLELEKAPNDQVTRNTGNFNGNTVLDPYYQQKEFYQEEESERPKIKVFKHPTMNVLVFEPTNFNDTRIAADALKASKSIIINYEKTEASEQVRICDFMNGACYVLDGSVRRISEKMVLYVPDGVTIESIITEKE